ncbi:hypothetical protein C6W88_20130 [Halomonas litopenaei]|uniref:Uncharacterized protein n=1 Tax=Halomonas litopenaei TaxID=2109328 RepID=A0ABX5IRD0_9GAMM|nr:hypothetical protein C6W88_20130 [Halomonas litopenaei]PTL89408.1 hypothetical protein C6W89_18835 [Halomonas sp. SYSU XM8]RQW69855.1 hypothetical protein EBB56_14390 [Halomonas sp. YLB-10]
MVRKRSLRGVNEHFDPIFNAVLPSAGTFQTSPKESSRNKRCLLTSCLQSKNKKMPGHPKVARLSLMATLVMTTQAYSTSSCP